MKKKLICFLAIVTLSVTSIFATYPKVALVLSGGGAKGFSEIAVIEEIQKLGIPIDFICGTSMGALVGGYYAAGYSSEEILQMLDEHDLASMLFTSPSSSYPETPHVFSTTIEPTYSIGFNSAGFGDVPGIVGDQKIQEFLSQTLIKNSTPKDFSELFIPFKAVATNATNNEQIIIDSGLIQDSMRSSMSLPLVFPTYVLLDGRYTMDGGLNNNMPIDVAERWGADIIIAIDVTSKDLKQAGEYSTLTGIIQQTMSLVTFTANMNAEQRCDLVMYPEVDSYSVLDMGKKDEILQRGYDCARLNNDKLLEIRDRISRTRNLVDYETVGAYSQLPDPVVKEIKIIDVINSDKSSLSLINIFDKYVGKTLTNGVLKNLNNDLEGFNKINSLSTTSYSFESYKNNKVENNGILYIYIRDWYSSESNISISIESTAGLSNLATNYSWAHTNFAINVFFDDLKDTPFNSNLSLSFHDVTTAAGDIRYNILSEPNKLLSGYMKLALKSGGISPANSTYMEYHVPSFGISGTLSVGSEYQYSNNFRAEIGLDYTVAYLPDTTLPKELVKALNNANTTAEQLSYTNPIVTELLLKAGIVYNLKNQSVLSTDGFYFKYAGMLINNNTNSNIGIGSELSMRYSYPFSEKDTFKANFDLNFNSRSEELIASYYDVGGYRGMIGYPCYTLRRGYLLADLTYQRFLGKYVFPLYFQAGIKFLATDNYYPAENLYDSVNNRIMTADLSSVNPFEIRDYGIFAGLGTPIGIATAVIGVGVTHRGNISLVLEFI
jgi:NTE family protein